jgi:hypothetical protein
MPKFLSPKQGAMRLRIACAAARIMAEDGVEDFAMAKRRAARQLGAPATESLPTNDEVEAELLAYRSLYQGDEHRDRMLHLNQVALQLMRLLAEFRPYLTGAVLKGTAGRFASVDIELYADSDKAVQMFLMREGIPFDADLLRSGDGEQLVPVLKFERDEVPIRLIVLDPHDERQVRRNNHTGRSHERLSLDGFAARLALGG